jgi:hypothetical protein
MNSLSASIGAFALALTSLAAHAANVSTAKAVQVTGIEGSRSTTNGYFVFTTTSAVVGCEAGFWVPVNDANYAAQLARVNDALVSKVPLTVVGDRDQLWTGSADKVCRIVQLK